MTPLTVVSPHRDDAAFSIGVTMAALADRRVPFRLVSCFTVSNFAPYGEAVEVGAISRMREREDQRFLEALSLPDQAIDLGRLDAPIRRSENFQDVCRRRPESPDDREETEAVARLLRLAAGDGPVILPLGLGGHIDHRIAKAAGILAGPGGVAGFYEELPYARLGSPSEILLEVRKTERQLRTQLMPVQIPAENFAAAKLRLIRVYSSQLSLDDMRQIADYGARDDRGERLWVTGDFCMALRAAGVPLRMLPRERRGGTSLTVSVAVFRGLASVRKRLKVDRILARVARSLKTEAALR